MDCYGDDNFGRNARNGLNERLNKERVTAIEVLHGKAEKNKKGNTEKSIKSIKSHRDTSMASSVKTTVAQRKKSPINKENICHNSKKSHTVSLEPKELAKSPTLHKGNVENSNKSTSTNPTSLRALQNASTRSIFEENSITSSAQFDNQSKLSLSDYDPYRHRETIDISDLITNDSVTLEYSQQRDSKLHCSVDEILASSFVEQVRNSVIGCGSGDRFSAVDSCTSRVSTMQKIARSKTAFEEEIREFNDLSAVLLKDSNVSTENFFPAKKLHSKLVKDEISWAKEYAAVPKRVLSDEALHKLDDINQQSLQESMLQNVINISAGHYFAMRSDNVINMILKESPERQREPFNLVGDDTEISLESLANSVKPVNNKTYIKDTTTLPTRAKQILSHDSNDSGNVSGKSDFLSLSTIDRALKKLQSTDSDSSLRAIQEMFMAGKSRDSNKKSVESSVTSDVVRKIEVNEVLNKLNRNNNVGIINPHKLSPLSSTCSCLSTSANCNDTTTCRTTKNCRCTPQHESTTNSELHYLLHESNVLRITQRPYSNNSVKGSDKGIPLKATELELSWTSVKLRTDSQKSMQVKNTSRKRLVVRVEIFGPGFQLINPENNMLTLHSQECRTIVVNFYPTMTGPAIGKLVFQPPRSLKSNSNSKSIANACEIIIPLYAYGGNASITVQHLLKGPVGTPFMPMGEFCTLVTHLERSFQIYNRGPLMGFAAIYIEPIGLHVPEISPAFVVYPECTLIEPNTAVTIRIAFQPNHSDLKKIRKIIPDVLTLAKLRIIYGDEATRQRLRQIQRATRNNVFTQSVDKLWTRFPGEKVMFPSGLFKDSSNIAQEMWACISEQEVALTLNNNMLDETAAELSTIFTEADNTILFRTVCVQSPTAETYVLNTTRPFEVESVSDEEIIKETKKYRTTRK